MRLLDKQALFMEMLAILIGWATSIRDENGHRKYRVRQGRGYASPEANRAVGGHPRSLHTERLAQDIILDVWDGERWKYRRDCAAYEPLGIFWEGLGGAWGGRFGEQRDREGNIVKRGWDGNHFSLEHEGMR